MTLTYTYRGVVAIENTETGWINVNDADGYLMMVTQDIGIAVRCFVRTVKEKPR